MKRSKLFLCLLLIFIEIISLFLTCKSFSNKEIKEVKEINKINNKQFSMFIETDNGYDEYLESNKFPEGYTINLEESKCLDTKGNVINGILSGSGTNITVTSKTTSYCYLYFDIGKTDTEKLIENVSSDVLWKSTLEGDGYRYVGTDPANYVCFGYEDATTDCDFTNATNTDLYAYRIIGIFEDSTRTSHIKLIKKEALNTAYAWNVDYKNDIDWDASDLYKGINGSYFLDNSTYSYMQDSTWTNKIVEWNYTATNTLTYENSGPNYYNSVIVQNIYLHEMNRSSKTSTIGEWKYPTDDSWDKSEVLNVKISLMYVSDYLLSLGSSALGYKSYDNRATLKTGWIYISNNDSGALVEWTMSRYGALNNGGYRAWYVYSDGRVYWGIVDATSPVRPVFYLSENIKITKGTGSITEPFIIN